MIEFDLIRKSSILRDKIYFICNQIKFYSTSNPLVTAFYFLTQSLALISTFTSSPLVNDSSSLDVLKFINSLFFFYTHERYVEFDSNLLISHLVSVLLLLSFITIIYFSWSIDHQNHLNITKIDQNKIKIVEVLVFLIILFNIPLGSFIWFYIIKLSDNNMVYFAVVGVINLISLFGTVYIVEECSIESNLKTYNSLSRLYSKNQSINSIVKMMIRMIIASFNNLTSNIILLSVIVLMIFDIYELRQAICSKKYLDSTTQSMYYYKNVITVILQILLIISIISSFPLIANNFILSTFSTSFLAFIALSQYKKYKKNHLILEGIDIVSNEDDAKIYMLEMISMIDENKKQEEVFALSLITIHREKCQQEACFCRKFNFLKDSKIINSYNFIKMLVMAELEKNVEKFPSSFLILSILLNYKLSIMSSFSKIYYILKSHINKNDVSMQSFSQQFMLYQIQRIIEREINKNTDKVIKVQKIFTEDQLQINLTSLLNKANDSLQEKYRLLNQQICNLNIIDDLSQQISNVLRIVEELWMQYEQKDSYNLKIYETFLIYFDYIIFSKRLASKVRTTLLKKAAILRHLKAITQQNLQKFLYSSKASILQIIFNKDKIGIITNITTSCKNVFNFQKQEMINKSIDEFMPEYFLNEHKKWIKQWFQHELIEGKMKSLISSYFVDKFGNGFTCNLNMKISSDGFRLKFYLIFVKANSHDYLILNNIFQIEGIGQKLQNQQLLQKNSLKKSLFQFTDMKQQQIKKQLQQKKMIKKRVVFRNLTNLDRSQKKVALALLNVGQLQFDTNADTFIFECQILFYQCHVNTFKYYIIKFIDIKKLHKMSSNYFFKTISNSRNLQSRKQYYGKCYKKQYNNEIFQDYSALGIDNFLQTDHTLEQNKTKNEQNQQNHQIERNNISSIAQSGYDGNIMFYKLSDELKQKTINYNKATDKRLQITSFIVFFMIGIVGTSSLIQSLIFQKGMTSYQQLLFVSSSISSNSQFLSVMYNRALTMNHYCGNSSYDERCQFIVADTKGVTSLVYHLLVSDYQVYLKNTTSLTSTKFYSYYDSPVSLTICNRSTIITAKQFIEYYYYSIQQIRKMNSKSESYKTNMKVGEFKSFLLNNWEVMKQINQDSITYYSLISQQEFQFMKFVTIFLYSLFLATTFIFLLFLYRYFLYIEEKKEKIVRMYSFLTNSMCNKLKTICQQVRQCLSKGYKDLNIQINLESLRDNSRKGQFRYHQGQKYHVLFILFFILMCSLNSIILYQIFNLFDPAQEVVYQSSKMTQSQNKAIQNLLDMKIMYLSRKYKNHPELYPTDYEELVGKLNKTQIDFAVNAKNMQFILAKIGSEIASQINTLLTKSVYEVQIKKLPPFLYERCKNGLHYTILNNLGTVAALNFMIRNQLNSLIKLHSKQIDNTTFYSPIFEDIDDNILYLIVVYQMIADSIKDGMKNASDSVNQFISVIIYVELLFLLIALIVWGLRIKVEKKKISNLYGQVFQLPQIIFKENKVLMKTLEDNLTLKL